MAWMWLTLALLVHYMELRGAMGLVGRCQSKATCGECLRSPGCAWCKQKDFLEFGEPDKRRCDTEEALRRRQCSEGELLNPKPGVENRKDEELGNVVQLHPQELQLKLRVGVPQSFEVKFKRAEGYPIDLYYLMDLSFSMKDDLKNVHILSNDIVLAMKNITNAVRIGFGSFVEKVAEPFISTADVKLVNQCNSKYNGRCQPCFSFRNVLPLTEDVGEFKRRVSQQAISSNMDPPEAGFDAIMQVAVCQKDIGWGNANRIVVYTSDGIFHTAGDGKLAGIYLPNDGKCHLNSNGFYDMDTVYDYPSIDHLSQVLSANNIKLIFAVTETHMETYQALSEIIPQSVVGVLADDSSNVVQLISEAYANLSSSILLEHRGAPPDLDISYTSHCSDGTTGQGQKGECTGVRINHQVNFTVTLTISRCFPKAEPFIIKVQGIDEELSVTVETLCDCNCLDSEAQSNHCSGNGTFNCGICSCDTGRTGQWCECEKQPNMNTSLALNAQCTQLNSAQLCSGHGSCICGHCMCRDHYRGQHCQCDDTSCNRYNNQMCAGNGKCSCGTCECYPNYTGSACECSTLTHQCKTGNGGTCSHHGLCECNQCQCHSGFFGKHCSKLLAPCQTYRRSLPVHYKCWYCSRRDPLAWHHYDSSISPENRGVLPEGISNVSEGKVKCNMDRCSKSTVSGGPEDYSHQSYA